MPIRLANLMSPVVRESHEKKIGTKLLDDMKAREEGKTPDVAPLFASFTQEAQRQAANGRKSATNHRQQTGPTGKANAKKRRRKGKHRRSSSKPS
jgi:hypothetical protein